MIYYETVMIYYVNVYVRFPVFREPVKILYSRNLFVLDFVRRFLSVVPEFLRRTLMKIGCSWRKISHKSKRKKDSEST